MYLDYIAERQQISRSCSLSHPSLVFTEFGYKRSASSSMFKLEGVLKTFALRSNKPTLFRVFLI